jgi:hypothetical protein
VGLFSHIEHLPEPFWTRATILYAAIGLISYVVSRYLFTIDSTPLLVIVGIARLSPLLLVTPDRKHAWPVALAAPYPFELVFAAYSERARWLPEDLALEASNPTAFLIFTSGLLLASLPLTGWLISRSVREPVTAQLRTLNRLLFGVTALAAILSIPQISVFVMKEIAQPVALAGYAAVVGYGIRKGNRPAVTAPLP